MRVRWCYERADEGFSAYKNHSGTLVEIRYEYYHLDSDTTTSIVADDKTNRGRSARRCPKLDSTDSPVGLCYIPVLLPKSRRFSC